MVTAIQGLRAEQPSWRSRIAVEFNASCPNIKERPPPSYNFSTLDPFLGVLAEHFWADRTLTLGIKLPPYAVATQIRDIVNGIGQYSRHDAASGRSTNPFAFLVCTNTLGNCLVFSTETTDGETRGPFAVPPATGGLAGEAIHPLSLGNVFSFSQLLSQSGDSGLQEIVIVGAGGVMSPEAVARMHRAGAKIVGCATLVGRLGISAFAHLSQERRSNEDEQVRRQGAKL